MPQAAGELVVAPRTAAELDVDVGDAVSVAGPGGMIDLTVVGTAFVPAGPHNDYASGGWVLPDAYDQFFDGFKFHFVLVSVAAEADLGAVTDRVFDDGLGVGLAPGPIVPLAEPAELDQISQLPVFLVVLLVVVAIGAAGHMLSSTVRHRSRDLATLQALGMTRRGTRAVVLTQSMVVAVIGIVVGVPIGVVVGRRVWGYVADRTPVLFVDPSDWRALVATVAGAAAAALLITVWPAHRIGARRVHELLRAE
jgi:predicted lysophospholipase L1 biosynthesis ABC-type transport system permease subunit